MLALQMSESHFSLVKINFCLSGIMPFVMQNVSPKPLFFITQLIHSMAVGSLCCFAYLTIYLDYDLNGFGWIPLAAMVIIIIMRATGSLPVMHTLVTESYPTDIRTYAIAITDITEFGVSAVNLKMFPELKNAFGYHGMFAFYSIMGAMMAFWGLMTIKDNRGKSLIKVEESYESKDCKA